ncbi:DDE-TNP-IS1595 domain-containing protein [Vairimorpha necatrix]|uniref:DDE-TNP-IS1595 domain-containing protein n=1 Tax=Vairimorpha necatrix TaxID=6039 RepID=A0AAX4JIE4_9MICR
MPGTTWLVGGIENEDRDCFLKIVPNRTQAVMLELFREYVLEGTIIRTDGFASYRSAVRDFGSVHEVVNHSVGFTNEYEHHTTKIENLWSHLKTELRTRRGIMKVNMEDFIYEFLFRSKYLKDKNIDTYAEIFKKNTFVRINVLTLDEI